MRNFSVKFFTILVILFVFGITAASAGNSVKITEPPNGAVVSSPVKVCMETHGVEVEPAKNGVNDGKGHHHLLIDTELPSDLSKPIGKDAQHVHMGDGSTCKELTLDAGKHSISALFAKGNHVPYDPAITTKIEITVK
ncbi:MAG: DUF4399 domain-containing protein [Nitrospinae bacterium]|jgi:hypothetical protein|nr:DUF4399 domain-containing protein [Nitrospinota bacterium]MDA1108825.1 DUF4399 domain-containing protein [Nitrospinota bacterium]